jgi:hypothetical protein
VEFIRPSDVQDYYSVSSGKYLLSRVSLVHALWIILLFRLVSQKRDWDTDAVHISDIGVLHSETPVKLILFCAPTGLVSGHQ